MSRPRRALGLLVAAGAVCGLSACGSATERAAPSATSAPPSTRSLSGATSLSVPTTLLPPSIKLPTGVEVAKDGDSLVLTLLEPALTFARDSADPADPGAARELASLVARAVQAGSPVVRVEVLGYASADGPSEAYDRTLSAARASTVCALLRSEGVTVAENDCRGEGRAGSGPESRRVDVRLVTQ